MKVWWGWMIVLLAGCTSEESGPQVSQGSEVRPLVAQHFTTFTVPAGHRLLVFGDSAHHDTIGDLLVPTGGLQRIATLSTTHLPYMSTLGCADRVVAAAHLEQVRDVATRERHALGQVMEIGTADGVDREALITVAPDVLLGYPFGRSGSDTAVAGVPLLMIAEYLEPHPLGRAEWLKFFGVLVGKTDLADSLYAGIADRYERAKATVGNSPRPKVLFGSQWNGQWWVPPGNSYMAQLIKDAGGDYIFSDRRGKENNAVDMETMLVRAHDVDRWGMIADLPHFPNAHDFTGGDARLAQLRVVRMNELFLGNTASKDLFGQALVEPDVVLMELTEIMHPFPGILDPTWHPGYFERLRDMIPPPPEDQ
ncbi:MAG: ABC transporter substrate-binding protein [Flavobacteriales bacterium]|nr:MAG: ABC transporter substrate-binding protein [Flavobacteriales bacterium]